MISNFSLADTTPSTTYYSVQGIGSHSTSVAACAAYGQYAWPGNSYTWTVPYTSCYRDGSNIGVYPVATQVCFSGTLSGTSCINVPACVSPQVRNLSSPYTCGSNPCSSGTVKDLTYLRPSGSPLTIYMGQGPSIVDAGCNYSCSDVSKATLSNSSGNYSTFSCTSTGVQNATSTSTPAPSGMIASTSTATNQTCNTVANKNVCTGGDIPAGCSYINGVKTCGTALDTATVNNISIKATDSKNCVVSGGKTLCITPSANTSTNNLTANSNGTFQGLQFENGVKTTSSTATTANPDGSTSTTITETTNIYGQSDGVTTTNCITAGNCTSTKTGGSNPQADVAASAAKAECSKPENANSLGCIDATKTVSPTPDAITNSAVSATLNVGSYDSGSCPPDQSINTTRGNFTFSNAPICSLASSTKPFAVALAFLTAGLLVLSPIK